MKKQKKQKKTENIYKTRLTGNKKIAMCGSLTALAMIFSYLESLVLLDFAVPGVKLGLANMVTIVAMIRLDIKSAVLISTGRILLSGILFGNPVVIIYSLVGAGFSILVMYIVKSLKIFTVTGISICGAVAHNAGQIVVAAIALENANIFYYMTVLAISGAISGAVVGWLTAYVLKKVRF